MILAVQLAIAAILAGAAAFGIVVLVKAKQEEAFRRRIAAELEAASKRRQAEILRDGMPRSVEEFLNAPISPGSGTDANKPN